MMIAHYLQMFAVGWWSVVAFYTKTEKHSKYVS